MEDILGVEKENKESWNKGAHKLQGLAVKVKSVPFSVCRSVDCNIKR